MATNDSAVKGVQVSATISKEKYAALENHRWDVRKTKAQVVAAAIDEYIVNHDLAVDATPETEAPVSSEA